MRFRKKNAFIYAGVGEWLNLDQHYVLVVSLSKFWSIEEDSY